jgi:hypothetical protein
MDQMAQQMAQMLTMPFQALAQAPMQLLNGVMASGQALMKGAQNVAGGNGGPMSQLDAAAKQLVQGPLQILQMPAQAMQQGAAAMPQMNGEGQAGYGSAVARQQQAAPLPLPPPPPGLPIPGAKPSAAFAALETGAEFVFNPNMTPKTGVMTSIF